MKTSCCFISVCILLMFVTACQKELKYDDLIVKKPDSITLVRSITTTNYDKDDIFLWKTEEVFNYESKDTRMTIDFRDSSSQGLFTYTETFSYDNNKRLTGFESTNKNVYYTKIEFLYKPNGNLDKARLYLVNGEIFENPFTYATSSGNTVITMYDTSKIGGRHTAYRPQVIKYTFNGANKLVRQLESETGPDKSPGRWLRDTFDYKFVYDPASNVETQTMDYTFVSNGINTPYLKDSVSFKREEKGQQIYETFINIYRNLYWFSFSEFSNNSFADAMVHSNFYPYYMYQFKTPPQKIDYYFTVSIPAYTTLISGTFQHTIDNTGLVVRSVYPKNFANNAGGRAELNYTYVRIRK